MARTDWPKRTPPSPQKQETRELDYLALHPPPLNTQLEMWLGKGGEIYFNPIQVDLLLYVGWGEPRPNIK